MLLEHPLGSEPGAIREVYSQSINTDLFIDHGFVVGDHAYLSARRGAEILVVDWRTGDVTRRFEVGKRGGAERFGMTYADGRVYSLSATGRVTLAAVSADGYQLSGSFELPGHEPSQGAALPVVTGGRLYLRSENVLFCYDVTAHTSPQSAVPVRIVLSPPPAAVIAPNGQPRVPRPIFVPTPQDVVERMLELAKVEKDDTLVDLGSGDGRIVITAAKTYGCHAVGYEIDQELVKVSQQQIAAEELSQLAEIKAEDMYTADLSDVHVVVVYVYPSVLEKMKTQFAQLPAGARIVSHQFEIPGVKPTQTVEVDSEETGGRHKILVYTVPLTVSEDSQ
jgi:protein-L-isoaspartate O-methyltransferase